MNYSNSHDFTPLPGDNLAVMVGRVTVNPHSARQKAKMKKRGAKWVHVATMPVYRINWLHNAEFSHTETVGGTYRRPHPKPLSKKERRKINRAFRD